MRDIIKPTEEKTDVTFYKVSHKVKKKKNIFNKQE